MFEVNVKNMMEEGRRGGGGDQLGFGVLILLPSFPEFFQPNQSEHPHRVAFFLTCMGIFHILLPIYFN